MGAVGAFDGAIEFGRARGEHEQVQTALLASLFEVGRELRAAVDLHRANGKGHAVLQGIEELSCGLRGGASVRLAFCRRVIFPCRQHQRMVNLYGRSVGAAFPHRLLPRSKGGLFAWESVRLFPQVILVEGLFDLTVLWQEGFLYPGKESYRTDPRSVVMSLDQFMKELPGLPRSKGERIADISVGQNPRGRARN